MEWQKWTAKHKSPTGDRPFHVFPIVSNPQDLGLAIVKWWNKLQPSFRHNSDTTNILEPPIPKPIYTPPTDVDDPWGSLSRAGPNGLASLVILLMWWGSCCRSSNEFSVDTSVLWHTIITDVTKTLTVIESSIQLASNMQIQTGKRKRAVDSASDSGSNKRYVSEPIIDCMSSE